MYYIYYIFIALSQWYPTQYEARIIFVNFQPLRIASYSPIIIFFKALEIK